MLSTLKESAASCSTYIRMSNLDPGRYEIRKFSLRDSQYGKRLVIEVEQGYVYLPEKMLKKFNSEKEVNKLNRDRYDLVYEGNDSNKFTFEMHDDSGDENDDENIDEEDSSVRKSAGTSGAPNRKRSKK